MARVRCPCGAPQEVADDRLGGFVTCPACGDLYMAERTSARPQAPTKRIGEMAVEHGLVSREHLDLCVEYQDALRSTSPETKRLGEILVDKGLLKPQQIEDLLQEQRGQAPKRRRAPARLVTMAEAVEESLKLEEPEPAAEQRRSSPWIWYLVLAVLAAGGVAAGILLWPAPEAQRTLAAYLRGCGERAAEKADHLAVRDLEITVREFRIEGLAPAVRHDYTHELNVFASRRNLSTWAEFAEAAEMSAEKRQAIERVLPCFPGPLTPEQIGSLAVTVEPATVLLLYRPRGERFFRQERCRFLLVRIDSARWSLGWRVASYESIDAPAGQ